MFCVWNQSTGNTHLVQTSQSGYGSEIPQTSDSQHFSTLWHCTKLIIELELVVHAKKTTFQFCSMGFIPTSQQSFCQLLGPTQGHSGSCFVIRHVVLRFLLQQYWTQIQVNYPNFDSKWLGMVLVGKCHFSQCGFHNGAGGPRGHFGSEHQLSSVPLSSVPSDGLHGWKALLRLDFFSQCADQLHGRLGGWLCLWLKKKNSWDIFLTAGIANNCFHFKGKESSDRQMTVQVAGEGPIYTGDLRLLNLGC